MTCNTYLEIKPDYVKHINFWVYYIKKQTLIDDVCKECEFILECNYLKFLDWLEKKRKEERDILLLKKRLWKK